MSAWYEASFGEDYLALYPHRDFEEARADVAAILALIDPPRLDPLLDLCCGAGRHLRALREAGFSSLTGMDLSQTLLDVAQRHIASQTGIRLLRADMRRIPFDQAFATILSLFTSFGYFDDDDNQLVLDSVYRALRPGGVFLLDTMHRASTIANLSPHSEQSIDGDRVIITRSITPDRLRIEKTIRIQPDDKPPRRYNESVRMYEAAELRAMLERVGFRHLRFHGALDGRLYDSHSPRMIAIASKPLQGGRV